MTKLIDITGKVVSGEWGKDDVEGSGVPVLRTTNFTNVGEVNYENVVTRLISKNNIKHKYLVNGDIIIEKSGGSDKQPVGRVIFFQGEEEKYLFNNFTGLLRVKDRYKWNPKYVFYSLFSNYKRGGTRAFENKTTGLHNLKTENYVKSFEIKDLSIDEQDKVCNILDNLTRQINSKNKQLQMLNDLIKSRFVELNKCSTENNKLGDFIKPFKAPRCGEKTIPILSITQKDGIVLQSEKFKKRIASLDTSKYKVVPRGKLVQGIHIDERNFAIQNIVDEGIVSPAYKIWTVDDNLVIPEVLAYVMRTDRIADYISAKSKGSVKRRESLTNSDFLSIPVNMPDLTIQKEFSMFCNQVDKLRFMIITTTDKGCYTFESLYV